MTSTSPAGVPARGTRPRNRRDLIISAATELFTSNGYPNVSMSDIAEAVNAQPSALYRHFSGKHEILREAISRGARLRLEALALGEPTGLDEVLADLARSALLTRRSSLLWTSEVRNLDDEAGAQLRREYRALPEAFAEKLRSVCEELDAEHSLVLAWAALDILASIAFHAERLPNRKFQSVLCEAMRRVVLLELPPGGVAEPPSPPSDRGLRREAILRAAATLFSRRGYSGVTLDDIGVAVGMAGASLYNYFPGKQSLVAALMIRSVEWQEYVASRAVRGVDDPRDRLQVLVSAFVEFTFEEPALVSLLLTEMSHLPDDVATSVGQAVTDSVSEWVDLVRTIAPERDLAVVRVQVQAARMIALDVLGTASLRGTPGLVRLVTAACCATLDI